MRRWLVILMVGALVAGMVSAPASAKKKKKKKKPPAAEQVDQQFFLRSTGCPASDPNSDFLSVVDLDETTECFFTGAGVRYEIGNETGTLGANGTNAVSDREAASRYWDALDGVPLVLDGAKQITGSIWTSGGSCVVSVGGQGCSPVPLSLGEMIFDITFVGTIAGEEVEIGTYSETYDVIPGTVHQIEVAIDIDPAAAGKTFDSIEMRTWQHGYSAGHGVIKTNGDTSSFLTVPTLVGP